MDIEAGGPSSYQNSDQQSLPGGAKIVELQNDVNQLTGVMKNNINKILERGDRIDTLNERSELLSGQANEFRINSRSVRRKFWWQNLRFQLVIGVIIMAIIIITIYTISK